MDSPQVKLVVVLFHVEKRKGKRGGSCRKAGANRRARLPKLPWLPLFFGTKPNTWHLPRHTPFSQHTASCLIESDTHLNWTSRSNIYHGARLQSTQGGFCIQSLRWGYQRDQHSCSRGIGMSPNTLIAKRRIPRIAKDSFVLGVGTIMVNVAVTPLFL